MKICKLCSLELTNPKDFNLIAGSSEFQPIDAIAQLPFAIASASQYVCRRCRGNLKLYVQAKKKTQKLEEELRETYFKSGSSVSGSCTHKEQASTIMESKEVQTNLSFALETGNSSRDTVAYVHVCWPTGDRSRKLPPDLTQMAIYLLRTQNQNIAKLALKHPLIRHHIVKFLEKDINKECQEMCRETIKVEINPENEIQPKSRRELFSTSTLTSGKRKIPAEQSKDVPGKKMMRKDVRSIFKKTSKEDMMAFTFEKANQEMKERCPLFWTILMAACKPHNSRDASNVEVQKCISVVTAASICLKNRSQRMTVVQLMISLIINHSSYTVSVKQYSNYHGEGEFSGFLEVL